MADGQTLEQRLDRVEVEQVSLRDQMRAGFARMATREDLHVLDADLRAAMQAQGADLRAAMQAQGADLRAAMQAQGAELRTEMQAQGAGLRADMQKWHDESVAAHVELREYIEFVSGRDSRHLVGQLNATGRRIDRLERRMDAGFTRMTRQFAALRRDVLSVAKGLKRAPRKNRGA